MNQHLENNNMYAACFILKTDKEQIQKIDQMLENTWRVGKINLVEYKPSHWIVSFVTDDNKKPFKFMDIVTGMGVRVLKYAID